MAYTRNILLKKIAVILLVCDTTGKETRKNACSLPFYSSIPRYSKEGDIILGGIFQLFNIQDTFNENRHAPSSRECLKFSMSLIRHYLAVDFAVKEINQNTNILPNITLGYELFDTCLSDMTSVEGTLKVLSGGRHFFPNYNCRQNGTVMAIIGHLLSSSSLAIANLLQAYKYPQVSYGATDTVFNDRTRFPFFFRMVSDITVQNAAIVQLLKHFGWTWVGIVTTNDDSNERASDDLKNLIIASKYCVAYVAKIPMAFEWDAYPKAAFDQINQPSPKVIVLYVQTDILMKLLTFSFFYKVFINKVLILPNALSVYNGEIGFANITILNGSLMFFPPKGKIPGLKEFILKANASIYPQNPENDKVWYTVFSYTLNDLLTLDGVKSFDEEYLKLLSMSDYFLENFRFTYSVYTAVYALAHALHNMLSDVSMKQTVPLPIFNTIKPQELTQYLKDVHFVTSSGDDFFFDENGNPPAHLDLLNFVVYPNSTTRVIQVGKYNSSRGQQLFLNDKDIVWGQSISEVPISVCSKSCSPGFRKVTQEGEPICCYECIPCSEGEISNMTDMTECFLCPDDEWPDEKKIKCLKKTIDFLSFEEPLGLTLEISALILFFITFYVLGVFITHRDTPIVKANNRDLSFTLLISLMLSFLCPFLFIGQPTTVSCILRPTAFSSIFTVSVSSILAKTITVLIAFKCTKPRNKLKHLLGKKSSALLILLCSLVEFGICTWTQFYFPQFPNRDTKTKIGTIIFQCSGQSNVGFYIILGYILILSLSSFGLAFMVRKLPDRFNEAHYITFSMLVFCSVWIAFIPAYLSAKGKYMVAVEIFAILASGAGLLSFIFFPKCYTILITPHLNKRERCLHLEQK